MRGVLKLRLWLEIQGSFEVLRIQEHHNKINVQLSSLKHHLTVVIRPMIAQFEGGRLKNFAYLLYPFPGALLGFWVSGFPPPSLVGFPPSTGSAGGALPSSSMASSFPPSDFPPLSRVLPPKVSDLPALNWSNAVSAPRPPEKAFALSSSTPPDDPLDFTEIHVSAAKEEWNLSLVGYSIGRRPFYESLLSAMRKLWKQLLSLSDGFFLLKFSSPEDYDMALSGGVWFFLGKPFVLQKWVPNFKPQREEFSSIPIWLKILDLPLPCWTPEGISRIASKIGVPLAVDNLTAEKTRLTYARVCVQVTKDCLYPEDINISILGEPFTLKIQYEWKPIPCEHCKSIVHPTDLCPSRPQPPKDTTQAPPRGRSTSRKSHRSYTRHPKQTHHPNFSVGSDSTQTGILKPNLPVSRPSSSLVVEKYLPPVIETSPNSTFQSDPTPIPNLNSPVEVSSTSCSDTSLMDKSSPLKNTDGVLSPNKFEILQDGFVDKQAPPPPLPLWTKHRSSRLPPTKKPAWNVRGFNSSEKVRCCKDLARHFKLDLLCVLENRIHADSFQDPWFRLNHCVFDNEESCNNFDLSRSGRIWVKWNPSTIQFSPTFVSSQTISGNVQSGSYSNFFLSVIYASNSQSERKSGGSPLLPSQLWDLNNFIFDMGLLDLASKGLNFSWFNQRANDPIHLKLDRMLINDKWLENYPNSYYEIASPICSDHSPIILHPNQHFRTTHRFLFKNFWTNQDDFWFELLSIFSTPCRAIIPQTCLNKIGKICAKFLYFGDSNGKKLHLVSWNNTSRPKILGGLGIPNLKALQFASCCSLIIRFYNSNSLLFDYLNEKYGTPWTPVRNNTSALWKWMIKVAHSIAPNLKFAYTPNSRIALLWDPWLDGCQFNYSSQDIRDNFPFHAKVSDYVDLGTWLLPEPLVQNLDSFSITSVTSHGVTWKTCKPCFSVFILEYFKGVEPVSWAKFLWHKHFALKYTIYAWLALNRGLKTADELSRRNILINHTCPLCFNHPESTDHLFFECDYGFTILVKLMPSLGNFFFRPRLLQLLEYLGDCDFLDKGKQNLYLLTVCCAIYYLWRERNERRFNSNFRSTSTLCSLIKHAVEHKAFKWKVWVGNYEIWL
ncbi:hypothetical protein M5K25_014709 [Dendrobium thyrsiflorum]|uniref:Reverse transcriptase zinc-binding domain-containing protein n=1 Tax=Dendrobium thyrsiflorum TaxID=117978 RepID=A0ABD0UNQ1_DENTH